MNTRLLTHARRLWANDLAPHSTQRHNARAWARSVALLGPRWLLAQPVQRLGALPGASSMSTAAHTSAPTHAGVQ